MDMGVEPFLLVSTLRLVMGQRLVRRLCDGKEEYALDSVERGKVATEDRFDNVLKALVEEKLVKEGTTMDTVPFYKPVPSPQCEDGYSGRIGIHEVLMVSSAIRELILHGAAPDAIEAQARKEGMLTMLEDGLYKSTRGITSVEEVLRAVSE